jgi:23S rRNA (guanosine2251-2'-O)-methyltransferase
MKLAVVLDNIRSVHNVGSIFRTADAAGVEKIYCCGITPGPLDRFKNVRADFAKVALGAEESVAWEVGGSMMQTADVAAHSTNMVSGTKVSDIIIVLKALKKDGWQIFAVEQAKDSIPYFEADRFIKTGVAKVALVLGAEVEGISAPVLALADRIFEIPMHGKKESLNVAVAFGIVAFSLVTSVLAKPHSDGRVSKPPKTHSGFSENATM